MGNTQSATVYEHANFQGRAMSVTGDMPDLRQYGWPNDRISSVKVPAGYELILYNDPNYRGTSYRFGPGDTQFIGQAANDKASSLRFRQISPPPQSITEGVGKLLDASARYEHSIQQLVTKPDPNNPGQYVTYLPFSDTLFTNFNTRGWTPRPNKLLACRHEGVQLTCEEFNRCLNNLPAEWGMSPVSSYKFRGYALPYVSKEEASCQSNGATLVEPQPTYQGPTPTPAPAQPQAPPTYTFYPGYDSAGNDIRRATGTVDELKAMCTANPECAGFNSSGWIKRTVTRPPPGYSPSGLYVKNPANNMTGGQVTEIVRQSPLLFLLLALVAASGGYMAYKHFKTRKQ